MAVGKSGLREKERRAWLWEGAGGAGPWSPLTVTKLPEPFESPYRCTSR